VHPRRHHPQVGTAIVKINPSYLDSAATQRQIVRLDHREPDRLKITLAA
jgi:hypothetical protein